MASLERWAGAVVRRRYEVAGLRFQADNRPTVDGWRAGVLCALNRSPA
jgi:hypothetical protein